MSSPNTNVTNGQNGAKNIVDTTAWTATAGRPARYIQVLNDAVVASYTDALEADAVQFATLTIPAGVILEGRFTAITLTSGAVRIYF